MARFAKLVRTGLRLLALATVCAIPVKGFAQSSSPACPPQPHTDAAQLVACIQLPALWQHMVDFQHIADTNPGTERHGNRDSGQPGYKASVDYVAGLMQKAGYKVTLQTYYFSGYHLTTLPVLSVGGVKAVLGQDWTVARLSGSGDLTGRIEPIAADGCSPGDFANLPKATIVLLVRGGCTPDVAVANAAASGALAVFLYRAPPKTADAPAPTADLRQRASLRTTATIPVAFVSTALATQWVQQFGTGHPAIAHLHIRAQTLPAKIDYNLIADSPFGDPDHVVVAEAHLDSIYGAGMLDNASGSTTLLETALQMAQTPTRNQLRYIWFGGEELGLLGSDFYTKTLSAADRSRIVFDIDSDVTATPNYAILIADPQNAPNVKHFPANVVPGSAIGNAYFAEYFRANTIPFASASFGNEGTDSNSFSLAGIPNTGILTQQDCCKSAKEVKIWGGFTGNYEGTVPGKDGGCVDWPHRWCDTIANNNRDLLEMMSQAFAFVTFKLANDPDL